MTGADMTGGDLASPDLAGAGLAAAGTAAAWRALLPGGTVWQPGPRPAPGCAVVSRPWALLRGARRGGPGGARAYLPVPSAQQPVIVASWDKDVMRYLAGAVLSVPPATGPVLSLLLTAGLRLFRHRAVWFLLAARPGGGMVFVGTAR
jgi:hypothetical protein